MTKREIFESVLSAVCKACEVPPEAIFNGCRSSEAVDARSMAYHYLLRLGLTPRDVIRMTEGRVANGYSVTKPASSFFDRHDRSFIFRSQCASVDDELKGLLQ